MAKKCPKEQKYDESTNVQCKNTTNQQTFNSCAKQINLLASLELPFSFSRKKEFVCEQKKYFLWIRARHLLFRFTFSAFCEIYTALYNCIRRTRIAKNQSQKRTIRQSTLSPFPDSMSLWN